MCVCVFSSVKITSFYLKIGLLGKTDVGRQQPGFCPIRSESKLHTTQVGCARLFSHMIKSGWTSRATSTSGFGDATCVVFSGKRCGGGLCSRLALFGVIRQENERILGGGELKAIWVCDEAKRHLPSIWFQLSSSPPCLGEGDSGTCVEVHVLSQLEYV